MIKRGIGAYLLAMAAGVASADNVVFKNGDHLTGTIEEISDTQVIFTSPTVGRLTLARDTVKTLQSDKPVTVVRTAATGPATTQKRYINPDASGTGWRETESPAAATPPAVAQVPMAPPAAEPGKIPGRFTRMLYLGPAWKNEFAVGYSGTNGNDDTSNFTASLKLNYDKEPHEMNFGLEGHYAMSNGTQTDGLFRQTAVYRYNFNQRWFWFVDDEYRYDAIKGLSAALTAATGPGYYLIRNPKLKVDLRAGPGIFYQRQFDGDESVDPSAEVGLRASYKINSHLDLSHETTYNVALSDDKEFIIKTDTAVNYKLDIERGLGLKLAFQDEYDGQPSSGKQHNDSRIILALTLGF